MGLDNHDALSCNCGHCHQSENNAVGKRQSFLKKYFIDILKISLSSICFFLGLFLSINTYVKLTFFIISALICGYELVFNYIKGLIKKDFFNEHILMIIASIVAFILGEFFEGSLIIILFYLGEFLEKIATENSKRKISSLFRLKSEVVHLIESSGEKDIPPKDVKVGSLILIKSGEMVQIDGVVFGESALLDMKSITGESVPCQLNAGKQVYSGSINIGNPFVIKTTKEFKDSTAEKIIQLVEEGINKKSKSQKFITKFAKIYTPIVFSVAIFLCCIVPLFDQMNFIKWIYKGLSFLVISCPCALVISVPLSYFVTLGNLARNGILVKGSTYLDVLSKLKGIVFDKTGTLTTGVFVVNEIFTFNNYLEEDILSYACSLEKNSNHPVANALLNINKKVKIEEAKSVKEITGKGILGDVNGKQVLLGNCRLLDDYNIKYNKINSQENVIYIAINGNFAGAFIISDKIKDNAPDVINNLNKLGITKNYVLSGDKKEIVEKVCNQVGIQNYKYQLLPEDKVNEFLTVEQQCSPIAYCGDGINDSPVLAMSNVGISMGGLGSDLAIETSNIVLLDDNLKKIPYLIKKSRKNKRIVLENIICSIIIKILIMILSIFITLPVWISMIADVGVMLLALLNSLRNFR